jgi:hypothetical protein
MKTAIHGPFMGKSVKGMPLPKRGDLGRMGDPITVAGTVYTDACFLCSDGEMSVSCFLTVTRMDMGQS